MEFPTTTRSELFIFAMALGIETAPSKLENIHSGGFILDSSIDSRTRSLMHGYFIGKLQYDNDIDALDAVTQKEYVYSKAQEYANTGFEILDDYVNKKKDSELIWDLIKELDDQYSKIFK